MSSKSAFFRASSHSDAIHCCLILNMARKGGGLDVEPVEEGLAKRGLYLRAKLRSFKVSFNKSLLASLSKECVILDVAIDMSEIADAL